MGIGYIFLVQIMFNSFWWNFQMFLSCMLELDFKGLHDDAGVFACFFAHGFQAEGGWIWSTLNIYC